jgi:hypothetical protein
MGSGLRTVVELLKCFGACEGKGCVQQWRTASRRWLLSACAIAHMNMGVDGVARCSGQASAPASACGKAAANAPVA